MRVEFETYDPYSIRIGGIGGQGNVLMSIILASALVMKGKWVIQTQSYGAQVRGGITYADVLFCDKRMDYFKVSHYDLLYMMHQKALDVFHSFLRNNGILIVDTTYVEKLTRMLFGVTRKIVRIPITRTVKEKLGSSTPANMAGLGVIAKLTGWVDVEDLKRAMREKVDPKYHELNEKAIDLGFSMVDRKFKIREEVMMRKFGRGFE